MTGWLEGVEAKVEMSPSYLATDDKVVSIQYSKVLCHGGGKAAHQPTLRRSRVE